MWRRKRVDLKQVAANAEVDLKRNDVFVEQISLMFLSSAKHPCQLAEVHVATFFARVCFFFCSELDKRRRLVVEDWAPSGKYNSRSRVPTLSCLSAAFLFWPPVSDLGLKEGFDFSSGCSCSESFLCCPLQRLYPAFFYTDIWVMSESNLICLSQIWNQKSAYLKHIPLRDKSA